MLLSAVPLSSWLRFISEKCITVLSFLTVAGFANAYHLYPTYICNSCSGTSGAILHYGTNNKEVLDGDMCLFDMGCEYHCYTSDITSAWPANGKFTDKQKTIYTTVLETTKAVIATLKPGVLWPDMHRLAGMP